MTWEIIQGVAFALSLLTICGGGILIGWNANDIHRARKRLKELEENK